MILMPMLLALQNLPGAQITRRAQTFAAGFARAKSVRDLPFTRGIRFTRDRAGDDFETTLASFQRLLKPCSVSEISTAYLGEGRHRGEKRVVVIMRCRRDAQYVRSHAHNRFFNLVSYSLFFRRGEIGEMELLIGYPPIFDRPF